MAAPDQTTTLYQLIRIVFRFCGGIFYSTTEVHGLENVPPAGEPAIVCFNHGNGLADPLVLIRKTPRMVRFCAKDSLWRTPVMKYFIRNSGAVPVYRAKDHGAEKSKDLNLEIFAKVIAALRQGCCLGFAPEGVSRFLPYMEQPFKSGVARIAIDAVEQATKDGQGATFSVSLVPVGLCFTHREKFRSDLCMRYCAPIKVDQAFLKPYGGDVKAAAGAITARLKGALEGATINAPDWETTRLAMTAARLHHPTGTDQTLGQYLVLLRGWVEVLKGTAAPEDVAAAAGLAAGAAGVAPPDTRAVALRDALKAYQDLLDEKKIKCERVRRAAQVGEALPWYWCAWGMGQRALAVCLLFAVALPGLAVWMPIWRYLKRQEAHLLSKGPRWNDSVAEMKMMSCGMLGIFYVIGASCASVYLGSIKPWLPLPYLYITMRCYEEAVADARSCYSLYKLLFLTKATMARMVALRAAAKSAMDPCIAMLPTGVTHHLALPADEAQPSSYSRVLEYYFPWWIARLLSLVMRRQKRDWNEVLRLNDASTMDYVR